MMDAECTESGHQARAAWSMPRHCQRLPAGDTAVPEIPNRHPGVVLSPSHPTAAASPSPPLRPARGYHRPGHHWQVCCLSFILHLLRLRCRALPHHRQVSSPHTSGLPCAVENGAGALPEGPGPCPHLPPPQADGRGAVLHVGAGGRDPGPAGPPPGPLPPRHPHGHLREHPRAGGAAVCPAPRDPRHGPAG